MSHDLRSPLNAVIMGVTLLLEKEDANEQNTKIALCIKRSAKRAAQLVGDLLDFTQARLGA